MAIAVMTSYSWYKLVIFRANRPEVIIICVTCPKAMAFTFNAIQACAFNFISSIFTAIVVIAFFTWNSMKLYLHSIQQFWLENINGGFITPFSFYLILSIWNIEKCENSGELNEFPCVQNSSQIRYTSFKFLYHLFYVQKYL